MKPLDPLDPEMKPLRELLGMLPKKPSPPTIWRWMQRGKNGTRLHALKIGQELYSTEAELRRFIVESQAGPKPIDQEAHAAAERELERRGYRLALRYLGSRSIRFILPCWPDCPHENGNHDHSSEHLSFGVLACRYGSFRRRWRFADRWLLFPGAGFAVGAKGRIHSTGRNPKHTGATGALPPVSIDLRFCHFLPLQTGTVTCQEEFRNPEKQQQFCRIIVEICRKLL